MSLAGALAPVAPPWLRPWIQHRALRKEDIGHNPADLGLRELDKTDSANEPLDTTSMDQNIRNFVTKIMTQGKHNTQHERLEKGDI